MAYNLRIKDTPFNETHELFLPKGSGIPCKPDLQTVDRMKTTETLFVTGMSVK
jgi:hypothetical protein